MISRILVFLSNHKLMMSLLSKVKMCSINVPGQAAGASYRDYLGTPDCLVRKPTSSSGIKTHIYP